MLLPSLLLFASSAYVEITSTNVDVIGAANTTFVKFYSEQCGHCKAMAADFEEASTTFTNVTFGGVECSMNQAICKSFNVSGYPTILLFQPGNKTGIEFKGMRSLDNFCDFIENHTTFKAKRPPKVTIDLNPINFEAYVNYTKCLFVTFYLPTRVHSRQFIPQTRHAAKAFLADGPAVLFGNVNCATYQEFCKDYLRAYPTIQLFLNGNNETYDGDRTIGAVLDFVNGRCGTNRRADGLLGDDAGIIPEASAVAREFAGAHDNSIFLEKMKAIPGAELYVKVIERFLLKGAEQVKQDMATMWRILDARKGSYASLDGLKKRYNVFREFFPMAPSPTPSPTSRPTSSADEDQTTATLETVIKYP
jgi:protein disulfide-isomerase A6